MVLRLRPSLSREPLNKTAMLIEQMSLSVELW